MDSQAKNTAYKSKRGPGSDLYDVSMTYPYSKSMATGCLRPKFCKFLLFLCKHRWQEKERHPSRLPVGCWRTCTCTYGSDCCLDSSTKTTML